MTRSWVVIRGIVGVSLWALWGGGWGLGQQCIYDWSPGMFDFPGPGVDGGVAAMVKYDDGDGEKLYIAGSFVCAGGVRLNRIARLGDAGFEPLGAGLGDSARTLAVYDDGSGAALYVGGGFQSAGGIPASRIARWKNGSWSALDAGLDDFVRDVAVFDDGSGPALFAGGYFKNSGGQSCPNIARWNGTSWSTVGGGLDGGVWDLIVHNDGSGAALYAIGSFKLGGASSFAVARWNGVAWSRVGTFGGSSGFALGIFKDGTQTKLAASVNVGNAPLQVWNGSSWSGLGVCPIYAAWTIGMFDFGGGARLCAGGDDGSLTGGPPLARWTGSTWEYVAAGPDEDPVAYVASLLAAGPSAADGVFVGGTFLSAGGLTVNNIALCQGGSSRALGSTTYANGLNSTLTALAEFDGGTGRAIYAGGYFTHAGTQRVDHIARWDGVSWSALNGGVDGTVFALLRADLGDGEKLYAGGYFTTAGGVPANHIAVWDGASWATLGEGFNNWIDALLVMDDGSGPALFAGGGFTASGVTPMSGVARWDGAQWHALGDGLTGPRGPAVYALCAYDDGSGNRLYGTGGFTTSGTTTLNRIARWSGAVWEPLGGGLGSSWIEYGRVLVAGDDGGGPGLFVGGWFGATDGIPAYCLIKWNGAWSAVGSGLSGQGTVTSLAFFDDGTGEKLYVSGGILKRFGDPGDCIARWDGQRWDDAGTSLNYGAWAMLPTVSDGKPSLYVGGSLTLAGGQPAAHLAKWTCRYVAGDLNCDGTVNQFDIQGFITALTDATAYTGAYPDCDIRTADANRDGSVNQFDIQPFVELLMP